MLTRLAVLHLEVDTASDQLWRVCKKSFDRDSRRGEKNSDDKHRASHNNSREQTIFLMGVYVTDPSGKSPMTFLNDYAKALLSHGPEYSTEAVQTSEEDLDRFRTIIKIDDTIYGEAEADTKDLSRTGAIENALERM